MGVDRSLREKALAKREINYKSDQEETLKFRRLLHPKILIA